jgi:hypothetical protein
VSGEGACKDRTHEHVVTIRNANYSAFSGYRRTWSEYSEIRCLNTGHRWRSKAKHVELLRNATYDEGFVGR